jgi:hypothetical protein
MHAAFPNRIQDCDESTTKLLCERMIARPAMWRATQINTDFDVGGVFAGQAGDFLVADAEGALFGMSSVQVGAKIAWA